MLTLNRDMAKPGKIIVINPQFKIFNLFHQQQKINPQYDNHCKKKLVN